MYLVPPGPSPSPLACVRVKNVRRTACRYGHGSALDKALEIYSGDAPSLGYDGLGRYRGGAGLEYVTDASRSLLLEFDNPRVRDDVARYLRRVAPCDTDVGRVQDVYGAYLRGEVDVYQYLVMVNSAAGRTRKDLSRYPVFPWIKDGYGRKDSGFRDFSKPVGRLNPERFKNFKERRASMGGGPGSFLYGTSYSAPGHVLFYLLRTMPTEALCLQGGNFDHPDRSFFDWEACWESVLNNSSDVKELVPDVFEGKALDNRLGIDIGVRQTGERVDDVKLPFGMDAKEFGEWLREELESPACRGKIHSWIDLVFGVNSRGPGAEESDNVFAPSAYYTEADLHGVDEATRERMALEQAEFGSVPDQLFVLPHGRWGSGEDAAGMWRAAVRGDARGREGRGKTPVKKPAAQPPAGDEGVAGERQPAKAPAGAGPGSPSPGATTPAGGVAPSLRSLPPGVAGSSADAPPGTAKEKARTWLSGL
eukprot:CAMPEP_0182460842 /NCGR_PEP_ID=MMETSP1319-20130603/5586_1 /TAXON_ID=172717 /ORGANISM="Bolidomonas pacifica, Strain RCC208" /LENGTH=477 /DNA_ID=CAMNT_0024660015 /DNA_START=937 /DNA_END=2367 /DNA_ORIENTATION=+